MAHADYLVAVVDLVHAVLLAILGVLVLFLLDGSCFMLPFMTSTVWVLILYTVRSLSTSASSGTALPMKIDSNPKEESHGPHIPCVK